MQMEMKKQTKKQLIAGMEIVKTAGEKIDDILSMLRNGGNLHTPEEAKFEFGLLPKRLRRDIDYVIKHKDKPKTKMCRVHIPMKLNYDWITFIYHPANGDWRLSDFVKW
jgi:hypothetical protein